MPRLTHRWIALAGAMLLGMLLPSLARAAGTTSCIAAQAISELEPDERDRLQRMCEGDPSSNPAQLLTRERPTLLAGLRLEGWKAAFVARAIAHAAPAPDEAARAQRDEEAWVSERLGRTRTKRGTDGPACETFASTVADMVRDFDLGDGVIPASLYDLGEESECVSKDEQEHLDALTKGYRLLSIPRRGKDVVEVITVSLDDLVARRVEPIPFEHDGVEAWLLMLPADDMVTVSVHQPDLDVPWIETRRLVDVDFALPRRRTECVILEVGADLGQLWSAVIDGSPVMLQVVGTAGGKNVTQRAITNLPRAARVGSGSRAGPREVVFVSPDDDVEPWITSLAQEDDEGHGRCRSITYDLTGLRNVQDHIGIAQVSVDTRCRDRGIVPSRVRTYVETYTDRADMTIVPLDAWAEVMEVFRDLEGRLGSEVGAEKGASRGDLDDSEQMVVLASELRRRGVDSLLYFDVRCSEVDADVTVIGTRVDLDDFVGRAQSRVTGVDTDDLLDVRSHDSRSRDLRESMEVVLSHLLRQSHVRFVNPPDEVEAGVRTELRVVGVDTGIDVEVWSLGETRTAAVCAEVAELNDLSSFAELRTVREAAQTNEGRLVLHRDTTEPIADVELGGLKKGSYLVIAAAMVGKDDEQQRDEQVGSAMCFEVIERELEIVAELAGMQHWTQPRDAPVSARTSFVRVGATVRYSAWELLEFGGTVGYEHVESSTSYAPVWEDLSLTDLSDDSSHLHWRRNGLFMGPFVGLRVPFGHFPWPVCRRRGERAHTPAACKELRERRQANPTLAAFFVDAQVMLNFGAANIDEFPAELAAVQSGSSLEADLDLGFKSGVRLRPRRFATFGIFGGVLLTDVTRAGLGSESDTEFWSNGWGVRGLVGVEVGWGLLGRRRS